MQVDLGNLAGRLSWAIRLDDYVGRLSCEIHLGDSLTKPMKRSSRLPKSDHFGREMFGNQNDTWLSLTVFVVDEISPRAKVSQVHRRESTIRKQIQMFKPQKECAQKCGAQGSAV